MKYEITDIDRILILLKRLYTQDDPYAPATVISRRHMLPWIGGYGHGRTTKGEPYISLFSPNVKMHDKVCRVYPHMFKRLPDFINTDVPENVPHSKKNLTKEELMAEGRYYECPLWQAVLEWGDSLTQLGRPETRYGEVFKITASKKHYKEQPASPVVPNDAKSLDFWLMEAQNAVNAEIFDLAMTHIEPLYRDTAHVAKFRELVFPGGFDPKFAACYMMSMQAYGEARKTGENHATAVTIAYDAWFKHSNAPVPLHIKEET